MELPAVSLPPLPDMWQLWMDGRLLAGRGTPFGITGYTGLGLPDQRTADYALPYEHGVMALGDYHNPRALVFNLCIGGRDSPACDDPVSARDGAAGAAWDALRYVAGVWQARTTDVMLELRMTTGQTYVLVGRPRRFDADTTLLRTGSVFVAAEFLATDPRLYSVERLSTVIQLADADDLTLGWCLGTGVDSGICLGVPPWGTALCAIALPANDNGEVAVINRGNTDTPPVVTFFGPAEDPSIINVTTDRELTLDATVAAGRTVTVDMRTRTVVMDGSETPRYDLLATAADFWTLVPGENVLHLRQSTSDPATAAVDWRHAWL